MSSANEVLIKRVASVTKHPNADSLDLVTLEDLNYTLISGLGNFQVGDRAVFFPIDSVLPDALIEKMGMTGKFDGKGHNRVKTKKLRGIISQGFIISPDTILDDASAIGDNEDISELLGIEKWEPEPPKITQDGRLYPLPLNVYKYDIESAQKYPNIVESLLHEPVFVSEKLEGMNFTISADWKGKISVCSRNFAIELTDEEQHDFHTTAHRLDLFNKINQIFYDFAVDWSAPVPLQTVSLRGEFVGPGIQKNIYNLKEHDIYFFDLEVNSVPVDAQEFLNHSFYYDFKTVPYIAINQTLASVLGDKDIVEFSDGVSLLAENVMREGIVVKTAKEDNALEIGRIQLKVRGPEYLAKSGN